MTAPDTVRRPRTLALLSAAGDTNAEPAVLEAADPLPGPWADRVDLAAAQLAWLRANDLEVTRICARGILVTDTALTFEVFDVDDHGNRVLAVGPGKTFDESVGYLRHAVTVPLLVAPEEFGL